jgi:hypothetical protein
MFDNDNDELDSSDIEPRTRRALEESMSVLTPDFQPIDNNSLTVVSVTTGSGSTYTVDVREGRCTCPDQTHRQPDGGCKHLRRAGFVLGRTPVPAAVFGSVGIADGIGANVDATAKVATADGGVIETGDDTEIVDDDDSPRWIGPHTEYNQYGEPTGAHYLECSACGVQVLSGRKETAYHTPECASRSGE